MIEIRRKVVGETWITTEHTKKAKESKNIIVETVERRKIRAIKLDCGHALGVDCFPSKVPVSNTRCPICEGRKIYGTQSVAID